MGLRREAKSGWYPLEVTGRGARDEAAGRGGSFGALLRDLREGAGLTQEELALRAGLSPNAVGTLERGARKHPYPHTVRSLADALGLSQDERATLLAAVPRRDAHTSGVLSLASGSALPSPPTPLVGRERELKEIGKLLLGDSEVRLLTLTGIGGVGKTRLALAAAQLQVEAGTFGTFTDAATEAGKAFGLKRGALDARMPSAADREKWLSLMRGKMHRYIKPEDQATWLLEKIRESAEIDKEADITLQFNRRRNPVV